MDEYYGVHTFDQTQQSWLREKDHVDAPLQGMMTIDITIHDKLSALWKKGAGDGKLRETV